MVFSSLPTGNGNVSMGDVSGQMAVGNYNLQVNIGDVRGSVVNIAAPGQQPTVRPRPSPVFLRPRPLREFLDRQEEVDAAVTALQSSLPVEFYGAAGWGKTSLLYHLAHHEITATFPDGVIYGSARHKPLEDVLQFLFGAFHQVDGAFKAARINFIRDAQVRHALQDKQALILLDDVDLSREEVEDLLSVVPRCTVVLASAARCLWGEGQAVALRGLPAGEALRLIERELGRLLAPEERPAAERLCAALEGHPLRILQAVAVVREEGRSLAQVADELQTSQPASALVAQSLNALAEPEKRVLAALGALGGAALSSEQLTALTGLADALSAVQALQGRHLVQSHSPRYSLPGTLAQELEQAWDLSAWRERALAHLTTWGEANRASPERLLEESQAILAVLAWGVETERWAEVLRLGRAVEGVLALGGWWGAWKQVLQWADRAASQLGDQTARAWSLHQLGTRALCLGDTVLARASLSDALGLREMLGDQAGAAVTRHNLDLLVKPPQPPKQRSVPRMVPIRVVSRAPGLTVFIKWAIVILVVVTVVGGGAVILGLSQKVTLFVTNERCDEIVSPSWVRALPGVRVFERIPPGGHGTIQVPRVLLGDVQVRAERLPGQTLVILRARVGSFEFPVTGGVVEVWLDGRSVLREQIQVEPRPEHELIIVCER